MTSDKGNVVDFQQYKERRQAQKADTPTELDSYERDFWGKLRLSKEDAEMIIYCMRLGREYFIMEVENIACEEDCDESQKDLDMVNRLLDTIQYEVLKIQGEEGYILSLKLSELAFIIECVEMTRNAVNKGINVFQWEAGDKDDYVKWLNETFFRLLDVYEKWRFYRDR